MLLRKNTRNYLLASSITLLLASCQSGDKAAQSSVGGSTKKVKTPAKNHDYSGLYVSEGYNNRDKGYDWVSVRLKNINKDSVDIQIRSREDQKKPTCTLDAGGIKTGKNSYKVKLQYGDALLNLNGDSLNIKPLNSKDEPALAFPCSGGTTIAGSYTRVEN